MYKNLLKACALAVFAVSSVESADAAAGWGANQENFVEDLPEAKSAEVEAKLKAYVDVNIFGDHEKFSLVTEDQRAQEKTYTKAVSISGAKAIKITSTTTSDGDNDSYAIKGDTYGKFIKFQGSIQLDGQPEKALTKNSDSEYQIGDGMGAVIDNKTLTLKFKLVDANAPRTTRPDTYKGGVKLELVAL